jgi:hypothetical protein
MLRFFLAALLAVPAFAGDDEGAYPPPPVQRALVSLELGDRSKEVQLVYPPARKWTSYIDPRGRVTRYRIERDWATKFPVGAEVLLLGFKDGRLADIQVIYDAQRSRQKTAEDLARELSLTYGEPERSGSNFAWIDDRTVLRVFLVEVPVFKDGENIREWRVSMEVLEKNLHTRVD